MCGWGEVADNCLIDESMLREQAVGGVFCKQLYVKHSFRPPDHSSVFQAEVSAIQVLGDVLLRRLAYYRSIHSNSRAAILDLRSLIVRSKLSNKCLSPLLITAR